MKKILILFSFLLIFSSGFGQTHFGAPEVDPIVIQSKFVDWSAYQNKNIMLSRDFVAVDATSQVITKDAFLNALTTGNYIPIRLQSTDSLYYYQLFAIAPTSDTSIKATIAQLAFDEYEHFKMEGKPFPSFNFVDLNGNRVTNATMKGKLVVIKCWYIHCPACIKEFPFVNALVERYKDRNDILFVSFAEDTPEQLKAFLAKKPLSYLVIPDMKIYMNETLHLNSFPTHFILDKEGYIAKVLLNYESLEVALQQASGLKK